MQDYTIDVSKIEELQMINDVQELDWIFQKAKSAIVCGAVVMLARKNIECRFVPFEKLTALSDLALYKKTVYKYLKVQ